MLEISAVTKKYGNIRALDQVSFHLEVGKTHVLLGSSGSGKSTILRAILNLIPCDEGSIQIDGKSVSEMTSQKRAMVIGYVPQDAGLFPHLNAKKNITLVAGTLGWDQDRIQKRLQDLNQIVSLDEALFEKFPSALSGGQKQRVALLRSLFLDPPVILMDEPFGALDPLVRAEIQSEFKTLFSRLKKTVLFVTHDVGEAAFMADHLILMHQGQVVQEGTIQDFIHRPAQDFVTKFLQAQRILQNLGEAP